ncbi:hypothetical protein D3C84_436870 [compost metagenome]
MQYLVHLTAELRIDLGNHAVNHGFFDLFATVLRLEQFFDKCRYTTLGDIVGLIIRSQAGFGDDTVKNAVFTDLAALLMRCVSAHKWLPWLMETQAFGTVLLRPSSPSTRSRDSSVASTSSMALRNAGALPNGPLRATSASRNSISFLSSGTC